MENVANFIRKKINKLTAYTLIFIISFSIYAYVAAAVLPSLTINSFGTILYGLRPLHVEGRHIKNDLGRIVILRGINMPRFIDTPYGDWILPDGDAIWATWDVNAAVANLDAMKSWGINVVRTLSAIEWWAANTGNHRQIIKDWITLAAARGIYVVYGFWCVTGLGEQSSLPYPPYCETNSYIQSQNDFVELWRGIANELKGYPNVIFELWNEPNGDSTAKAGWFNVVQQCINAIRSTGATNIVVVQWDYCLWVNMQNYDGTPDTVAGLEWIEQYPLSDTTGNILYSTHIYRDNLQKTTSPTYTYCYTYGDLKLAYQRCKVEYAINTLNKPVWIGEVGPNQWNTGDLTNEYAFYNSTLKIMNEWYIGYAAWWWWVTGTAWGHIYDGQPNYQPNRAGQILQYGIATGTLPPANATG